MHAWIFDLAHACMHAMPPPLRSAQAGLTVPAGELLCSASAQACLELRQTLFLVIHDSFNLFVILDSRFKIYHLVSDIMNHWFSDL